MLGPYVLIMQDFLSFFFSLTKELGRISYSKEKPTGDITKG